VEARVAAAKAEAEAAAVAAVAALAAARRQQEESDAAMAKMMADMERMQAAGGGAVGGGRGGGGGFAAEAFAPAPAPAPPAPCDTLTLCVLDVATGEETFFKVRYSTAMDKIFTAYATRKGVDKAELLFHTDRRRVPGNATPELLGLKDADRIDVLEARSYSLGPPAMEMPSTNKAEAQAPRDTLTLCVRDVATGEETFFKVRYSTAMDIIFTAYATRKGVDKAVLLFQTDGRLVPGNATPELLGLKDADRIDVLEAPPVAAAAAAACRSPVPLGYLPRQTRGKAANATTTSSSSSSDSDSDW
jgi:small ubiquitin-related modifier